MKEKQLCFECTVMTMSQSTAGKLLFMLTTGPGTENINYINEFAGTELNVLNGAT